jgi:diacylglycerol kinase (ATP)
MDKVKICFIVNPLAGKGKNRRISKDISRYFPEAEISFTKEPDNTSLLAKEAQESGAKLIVAGGGDGTVHNVVKGLLLPDPNLVIGILPLGTGNALAINLNIPLNPKKALKALSTKAKTMPMDLGLVDSERFINTVSIGLDAEINQKAIGLKSRFYRLPLFSYVPAIIKTMLSNHSWPLVSVYFGRTLFYRGEAALVSITNTPVYGIGFPINPQAKIDDGKLNLCLLKKIREITLPYYLLRMILKEHSQIKQFLLEDFTKARISTVKPMPLQIDGEPAGLTQEISISVMSKMLNVLYIPNIPNPK